MPFERDESFVGMIAYFTVNDLRRHPRVRTTNRTRDIKPRPFVCYAEDQTSGELYWTCLTGTPNPQRRTISRQWLRCPTGAFRSCYGDLIIADARSSFVGPAAAFAECSRRHDRFPGMYRPMLMPPGIDEVQMAVHSRRGLMPDRRVAIAA